MNEGCEIMKKRTRQKFGKKVDIEELAYQKEKNKKQNFKKELKVATSSKFSKKMKNYSEERRAQEAVTASRADAFARRGRAGGRRGPRQDHDHGRRVLFAGAFSGKPGRPRRDSVRDARPELLRAADGR